LQESVIDDIKEKSSRQPEEWDEVLEKLQVLPQAKHKQYLMWLEKVSQSSQEPLRDISPLIISFDSAKNRKKLTGRDADINIYKTPGDLHRKLEELPDGSKIDFEAASGDVDKVYESENFVVLMPRSLDASCALGRGTTWCTARTKGENLFYRNIIDDEVTLFYVLDKHDEKRKWSIGTVNGKVRPSKPNETTVNQDNKAFDFQEVFDEESMDIQDAINNHAKKIKEHPALRDVKKAMTSVPRFKKLIKGFRPDALAYFLESIKYKKMNSTQEVTAYMEKVFNDNVIKLSKSPNFVTREDIAYRINTPADALRILAKDEYAGIRYAVISNPATPIEILRILAKDKDEGIRRAAGRIIQKRQLK